ncbi:MAG TPA: phosphoribosylaminoimidazolesuccinocarboxamide synthase [Acidimicrobiales bacterium]|nr:phosphoribosylaminoimidazolesuccinocarboxamide synthase [Acidimicrobiales bacterium]
MKHVYSGKVREIYELDDEKLLFLTSDRISAFDVVMSELVPAKGRALTALTAFWLRELSDLAPSHLLEVGVPAGIDLGEVGLAAEYARGRSMVVRKAEMLPIECIVRGYLSGSAWAEYKRSGTMHGQQLPAGLLQSAQLPEPVFTPSTKATVGHDENISFEEAADLIGDKTASAAREICLEAYRTGAQRARQRGIIIADTKFELGLIDGELAICDEVMTPDSSRFWPLDQWEPGSAPPSFDKQPLRDWLESSGWAKRPPPPTLPPQVVTSTSLRYIEAYERLSASAFALWPGATEDLGATGMASRPGGTGA